MILFYSLTKYWLYVYVQGILKIDSIRPKNANKEKSFPFLVTFCSRWTAGVDEVDFYECKKSSEGIILDDNCWLLGRDQFRK